MENGNQDQAVSQGPSFSFNIALPLVAVGAFILALTCAFCCYLGWLKKRKPKVEGYTKVVFNKNNPLQDTKNESCPVCRDDFKHKDVLAICPCNHVFHKKCLCKWLRLKPTCPMCLSPIPAITDNSSAHFTTQV